MVLHGLCQGPPAPGPAARNLLIAAMNRIHPADEKMPARPAAFWHVGRSPGAMIATFTQAAGTVAALYSSPGHVYVGHFGRAPGTAPMEAAARLRLVAGRGIMGDRYFNRPAGQKGQVTFFSEEVWRRLGAELGGAGQGPEVFRRNVLTRGLDLLALVGAEFEIQGVRFRGTEHCRPCCWMDHAFAPGAFAALSAWQAGGLRAEVLTDGVLCSP